MVTGGGQPGPFGIIYRPSADSSALPCELIMKIGLLPDPCRTHWIRAFQCARTHWMPGFHGVPAGPAHSDRGADGAEVT